MYKIRNTLLPTGSSVGSICSPEHERIVFGTLDMYVGGGDMTRTPFVQWGREKLLWTNWWYGCEAAQDKEACILQRQGELIGLYESIKAQGYTGSPIKVAFDGDGGVQIEDGIKRLCILKYLGMEADMNAEISLPTDEPPHPAAAGDFPLAEVLTELYNGKNTYEPVHDDRVRHFNVWRKDSWRRLAFVLQQLEHVEGKTVLDIGCSVGFFAMELAKRGYRVTALDTDPKKVAVTKYLSTINNLDVDCRTGAWQEFLVGSGRYDNILLLSTFHWLILEVGVERAFEALRLLKGRAKRLIFECPLTSREISWLSEDKKDLYSFSEEEFKEKLQEATGMSVVDAWRAPSEYYGDCSSPIFVLDEEQYPRQYFIRINEEEMPQALRLADILGEMYHPKSVVDVGCATGLYLKRFSDAGLDVCGIELAPEALKVAVIPQDRFWVRDITEPLPEDTQPRDLLLCLEVLEHIDEKHAETVVDNLCKLSEKLVVTVAPPGQGGAGHVNCQPKEYWIDRFAKRGYVLNESETESLVNQAKKGYHHGWFVNNVMVFERGVMDLHFVVTGEEFPYPYYLAVMSALRAHKARWVNLWLAETPEGKYFDLVKDKVNLVDIDVPDFPALAGKDENFRRVHIKDYLEWKILYEHGGIFLDLDTLSLKDISDLLGDKEVVAPMDVENIDACPYPFNNAIVIARKSSKVIKAVLDDVTEKLNSPDVKWGETGPIAITKHVKANLDRVRVAEFGVCGGFGGNEVLQLYRDDGVLRENARVVHLFAVASGHSFEEIDEGYVRRRNTLYARLVRETLPKEDWDTRKPLDIDAHVNDRGKHYRPVFEYLRSHPCRNIMEVGTYDGRTAAMMIRAAAEKVPEEEIHYWGFDLFEETTPQLQEEEFHADAAHPPIVSMDQAKDFIQRETDAQGTLVKGNTRRTLRDAVKQLPKMDLIFIDGGHSIETIRSDWAELSWLVGPATVVFLDDYFPDMPFVGCKFLVDEVDKSKYDAQVLPAVDRYPKAWGHLDTQLLQITPKGVGRRLKKAPPHFRLHLLGLAHTKTRTEFSPCAYTCKVLKMAKMMTDLGHEVYHYGAEGSDPQCTEHIDVVSDAVQKETYGDYDWHKEFFKHDPTDLAYRTFNENAIREIQKRAQPRDMLLVSMGNYQKPIADAVGPIAVEMGIGYTGVFCKYRVFESYAWMHYVYGCMDKNPGSTDGSWYDAVIPNYFDPADFEFSEEKDDYYLYMGRLIARKGVHIAAQAVERLGGKLIVAGQGKLSDVGLEGKPFIEHVGTVGPEGRSDLMKRARATFVPTLYLEPFGGVAVESMFCGTPVITTDWGVLPETVQHGVTGYRCRTMDDFLWAARNIDKLKPKDCRRWAEDNYSMARVSLMYNEYFGKLQDLFGEGWYEEHPERKELDWLKRRC